MQMVDIDDPTTYPKESVELVALIEWETDAFHSYDPTDHTHSVSPREGDETEKDATFNEFYNNLQEYAKSRTTEESGCLFYIIKKDPENNYKLRFHELYVNEAAEKEHATNHVSKLRAIKAEAGIVRGVLEMKKTIY